MMRVDWQPALVLHKRAYRETSLQLELLTRDHGIIALVAKGVTSAKNHILRAQLQPLQHIKVSYQLRSELGVLTQSEALPPPIRIAGERLMAGLYLNELILKLCPRQDADTALYAMLLEARDGLSGASELAWLVRRFERDLIGHLGYVTPWSFSASDQQIRVDSSYRMHIELGLLPCGSDDPSGIAGDELIAFNSDQMPSRQTLIRLRGWLHAVIAQHAGRSPPRSWQIIGELSRPRIIE
jgi:DNA repair protein RecO (recombination protein O)